MAVNAYFRFLRLNRLQMLTLESEVANVHREESIDDHFIGCVYLDDVCLIDDISNFVVQQQISEQDCDILLAPTFPVEQGAISVSKIVNQMLKHIDCSISISTTPVSVEAKA